MQLVDAHLQGGQGARASGVDHGVGPAQIESIGDAAADHVPEQSGEGILFPRDIHIADPLGDRLDLLLVETALAHGALEDRLLQPAGHMQAELGGRGDPEHDPDALAIHILEGALCSVFEQLLGDDQRQELAGVGRRQDVGRHAEVHRREVHIRQERAAVGVGLVRGVGVGVVIILGQPMGRRHVGQQVFAGEDISPEATGVR